MLKLKPTKLKTSDCFEFGDLSEGAGDRENRQNIYKTCTYQ